MSEATRLAVREAAQQVRASGGSTAAYGTAPAAPRNESIAAPLALKPSRWTGAGGMRTAIQMNPSASSADAPLAPNSTSRGTP